MYDTFIHQKRRVHWLSYRLLLQTILNNKAINIHYSENGKPFLVNAEGNISVSHSGEFVAVLYSKHYQIGIDIEIITDRIDKLAERFASQEEINNLSISSRKEELYVIWGAKESLYKAKGAENIIFIENLKVFPFEYSEKGAIQAEVEFLNEIETYALFYEKIEDYMLVFAYR